MPRISRGLADDCIYHVINRGNGGQVVFQKDKDYEAFVNLMKEAKIRYAVKIFAYCLMPNHFHLVVMPHQSEDLSKWMQWLLTSHVRRFHKHYGTSGHIWQGRYKSFLIQKDSHLLSVLKYVESNPLRAGLVNAANNWLWSSHRESIHKGGHLLIDEVPVELPKEWSKFVNESIAEKELEKLRQSVSRQSPYGDSSWQVDVSKTFGLESTIRPRGRPRRED
jgi:putative transposase